jgi:hypothetical protein
MKAQEVESMNKFNNIRSVEVLQLFDSSEIDYLRGGWVIEITATIPEIKPFCLQTARGAIRKFQTLDAVNKFLFSVKIFEYRVVNSRNKAVEG